MEKLVLIDGNSLINRAFYAMPLLTNKDGVFTNAVYGFLNMLFKLIGDEKPTHLAVAFDVHAPTFRHGLYTEYKGTRKPMPEELRPQIPLLKEILSIMNIACIEKAGLEADDIIGTLSKKIDMPTVIFTGDRDSFQLVDPTTSVCFTRRGITDTEVYTAQNFKEKTGITPKQIIDLKALMGDTSDNIPGVKGIGEKTALSLIEKYGTVENLYDHTDELSGKLQEKIISGKESCFLSKTLATIDVSADITFDEENFKFSFPFPESVKAKFIELDFKSLYKKDELFSGGAEHTEKPVLSPQKAETVIIGAPEELPLSEFGDGTTVSVGENHISAYYNGKEYRLPLMVTLFDQGLTQKEAYALLKKLDERYKLVVFDKKSINHTLDALSLPLLKSETDDLSIIKYLADFSGEKTEREIILEYGEDENLPAYSLKLIFDDLFAKLKEYETLALYRDVELPLADVLFSMEKSGFKVDKTALKEAGDVFSEYLKNKESEIRRLAGEDELNVNSPKQLGEVLFEKLKIGKGTKNKSGYSTSAEILEKYEDAHPVVPLILEYRKIQKLQSTYVEGLRPLIDERTGLIHTSFNQTVTATGRLSSKEPNLQNIPVRDEQGKELRKFFVPKSADRILIGADYSQIELRLLAAFSSCEGLIKAFKNGKDIHTATAARVFGVPIDEVTKSMRSSAKAVNFGIIYGISEYGLAKNLGVSAKTAKEYIDSYFIEYPEVKAYMEKNVAFAKEHGYAVTMLKRRRYIKELSSSNFATRSFGERVAMNMPLQGSAADIIKLAMIGVYKRLKKENLKSELILQIHDELIIDAFESEKAQVEKILKEEMENAVSLPVKLVAELGAGKNWYETK